MASIKIMSIIVLVLGIVAVVMGGVFFGIGVAKNKLVVDRMNIENVTLALNPDKPNIYTEINDAAAAQQAADIIASHRRSIAPTYQELLGGKQFDPTNPTQLKYVQAMNLENYLYMAVTAFGLIQMAEATGGFMIITGVSMFLLGFMFYKFSRQYEKARLPV